MTTELILSDITLMKPGYCVIGLEKDRDRYRSIRPLPPRFHAWPADFPHKRGDRLEFSLTLAGPSPPHVEDRKSTGVLRTCGEFNETKLVECLRLAEMAKGTKDFFDCHLHFGNRGGYVYASAAQRSICGAEPCNVRLRFEANGLRAKVVLPSAEAIPDLPVVDVSWRRFVDKVLRNMGGVNRGQRINRWLGQRALDPERWFVRIGLTRPDENKCHVMLDTLLPMPRQSWLNDALTQLG